MLLFVVVVVVTTLLDSTSLLSKQLGVHCRNACVPHTTLASLNFYPHSAAGGAEGHALHLGSLYGTGVPANGI